MEKPSSVPVNVFVKLPFDRDPGHPVQRLRIYTEILTPTSRLEEERNVIIIVDVVVLRVKGVGCWKGDVSGEVLRRKRATFTILQHQPNHILMKSTCIQYKNETTAGVYYYPSQGKP